MYIDYSYWNELSSGTRLPINAARSIKNDVKVYGVGNDGFHAIHADYIAGKSFARLTAYLLDESRVPNQLEVIIGCSDNINQWDLY